MTETVFQIPRRRVNGTARNSYSSLAGGRIDRSVPFGKPMKMP